MSDFNLIAIRLPGTPGAISAAAITATVPDPPRNFVALDNGTILRGTVQGRDKDGLINIKTDHGILKISTNANLPVGSNVTLEVRTVGDRLQVVVLSVDQTPGAQPNSATQSQPATAPESKQVALGRNPGDTTAANRNVGQPAGNAGRISGASQLVTGETPPTVIVAGTRLTAIVIQSVPKELLQNPSASSPPANPLSASPVGRQSGAASEAVSSPNRAAFTAEFRQTPPPPISSSIIPEIHDRIAALFDGTALQEPSDDVATVPLAAVPGAGSFILSPELREKIVALFVGTAPAENAESATEFPLPPIPAVSTAKQVPGDQPVSPASTSQVNSPQYQQPPVQPNQSVAAQTELLVSRNQQQAPEPTPISATTSQTQSTLQQSLPPTSGESSDGIIPIDSPPPQSQPVSQGTDSTSSTQPATVNAFPPSDFTGQLPAGSTVPSPIPSTDAPPPAVSDANSSSASVSPIILTQLIADGSTTSNTGSVSEEPPVAQTPTSSGNPIAQPTGSSAGSTLPLIPQASLAAALIAADADFSAVIPSLLSGQAVDPETAAQVTTGQSQTVQPPALQISDGLAPTESTATTVIAPDSFSPEQFSLDEAKSLSAGSIFSTGATLQDPDVSTSPITPFITNSPLTGQPTLNELNVAGQSATKSATAGTGQASLTPTGAAPVDQQVSNTVTAVVSSTGKSSLTKAALANAEYLSTNLASSTLSGASATKNDLTNKQQLPGVLPTGTELRLRVLNIQQPGAPAAAVTAQITATAGGKSLITGQILGHTPAGHPVIRTSIGDLVLQQQATLPTGAQITLALEAVEIPGAAVNLLPATTPQMTALNLAQGWPTLFDLLITLQHASSSGLPIPGGGSDGTDPGSLAHLPQPGPKLAAGIANAVDAFRSGDFEKLFGPLTSALKTAGNKSDSIRKLRDEFTQMSILGQNRGNDDWRTFFLPLWDDGRLQQINLFYRRPRRGQIGKGKDDDATRFVVDVTFSKLGGCQLDGLIRKKHFDLMIRSHQELPLSIKRDIAGLFAQARDLGNYVGELSFQTAARFPVSPLDDIAKDAPSVTA